MRENEIHSLCVFCGSHHGKREVYVDAAAAVGRLLADLGITLIFGGGSVGLMGTLADTVLTAGGRAVGVIPRQLAKKELMHQGLSDLHIVSSMHERKALMSKLSDAFVALPGGFGTLEEVLEVITWGQLGIQSKPIGLLNVDGYFDPLLAMVDRGVAEGFIRPIYRELFVSDRTVGGLFEALRSFPALPSILTDMGLEET